MDKKDRNIRGNLKCAAEDEVRIQVKTPRAWEQKERLEKAQ